MAEQKKKTKPKFQLGCFLWKARVISGGRKIKLVLSHKVVTNPHHGFTGKTVMENLKRKKNKLLRDRMKISNLLLNYLHSSTKAILARRIWICKFMLLQFLQVFSIQFYH